MKKKPIILAIVSFLILAVAFCIYTTSYKVVIKSYPHFHAGYQVFKSPDRYEGVFFVPGFEVFYNTKGLSDFQSKYLKNNHAIPIEGKYWKLLKNNKVKLVPTVIF